MFHDLNIDLIEATTKKLEESRARYPVEISRRSKKYANSPKVYHLPVEPSNHFAKNKNKLYLANKL